MCTMLVLTDAISVLFASVSDNNLWIQWYIMLLEVAMSFWIVTAWPVGERSKLVYRVTAIATVVLVAVVLVVRKDRAAIFEQWISPIIALVALIGVVHALVKLSLATMQP